MLSNSQEKTIRQLHTKKGRQKNGLCLIEGEKNIAAAGDAIEYTFTKEDTEHFDELVTTQTPQEIAAVARIPKEQSWENAQPQTTLVVDGVQDPGNIGSILRLCLGFNAFLILVESVDVTNPKVIRSSAGALFRVPFQTLTRLSAAALLQKTEEAQTHHIYRLEKRDGSIPIDDVKSNLPTLYIAGSEGNGIQLSVGGTSVHIPHTDALESLNVTHAVAIALQKEYATSI